MIICTKYFYLDTSANVLRSLIDFKSLSQEFKERKDFLVPWYFLGRT